MKTNKTKILDALQSGAHKVTAICERTNLSKVSVRSGLRYLKLYGVVSAYAMRSNGLGPGRPQKHYRITSSP